MGLIQRFSSGQLRRARLEPYSVAEKVVKTVTEKIGDMSEKKYRLTHYELDPVNGPGMMVTKKYNLSGNPFPVFCNHKECEHFYDRPSAIPHWSEDCEEYLGVLRCPACQNPVVRPS